MYLKAVTIWNNTEKNGTFSLYETSVKGNVTFAYIMMFFTLPAYKDPVLLISL